MLRLFKNFYTFVFCLFFITHSCIAEEFDDIEFSSHRKSTIENFPLQAIDQETLSDTAIEGALQVQTQKISNADKSGKPIYIKQDEENQKKQTENVLSDAEKDLISEENLLKFSQTLPIQPQIQPIYQQPTGRTYVEHQTTTISRP